MPPLLGSHNRCWIWGRNLLREMLRAGRWRPHALHMDEARDVPEIARLADELRIPIVWESPERLAQRCGSPDHQGAIAKMPPFPYATIPELLEARQPRLVVADHLQDPFNFGAIIRSADCFGATGILIPRSGQVGVTSQVARSSAGAVNYLPIARSENLSKAISELQEHRVRVIVAAEGAGTPLPNANLNGPVALVIGNEATGVGEELAGLADEIVSIPITSRVGSLNAAVAAGVLLYEIAR